MDDYCHCFSRTLKVNGLVAILGLEIFNNDSANSKLDVKHPNICVIFLAMRPHSPTGLSELLRYHTPSGPGPQKHQ